MPCWNFSYTIHLEIYHYRNLPTNSVEESQIEAADLDFDKALAANKAIWQRELGKIRVSGGSHEDKVKFYTGLYHALLGRGCAMDADGSYPRNDGTVGTIPLDHAGKPQFTFCNTDAVWGAFWNLTQPCLVWRGFSGGGFMA